ncbi:hypothetical protein OCU04_012846 [Sclerotinia nivalis]|uniref:Uncharacterized protein n=1 Tax=Sclerotinia nivalis TaxID=352851 RepID=A0A9X0A9I3_9HELO|nr:hypothetical protein OCU04_012846 [Sclerotinia nivalis]
MDEIEEKKKTTKKKKKKKKKKRYWKKNMNTNESFGNQQVNTTLPGYSNANAHSKHAMNIYYLGINLALFALCLMNYDKQ